MAEIMFELETVSDKENGVLIVKDFEENLNNVKEVLSAYDVIEINNDEEKADFKKTRATFNKIIKAIDRKRIDTIADYCNTFEEQCNAIKELFDMAQLKIAEKVKEYEEKQKLATANGNATKYVATLKFTDEKIIKKLQDFAVKNGCELTIK